jgi:hypothetical protein
MNSRRPLHVSSRRLNVFRSTSVGSARQILIDQGIDFQKVAAKIQLTAVYEFL